MSEEQLSLALTFEDPIEEPEGMGRVQELENALGDLLDLWDEGYLTVPTIYSTTENETYITQCFDRAALALAGEEIEAE